MWERHRQRGHAVGNRRLTLFSPHRFSSRWFAEQCWCSRSPRWAEGGALRTVARDASSGGPGGFRHRSPSDPSCVVCRSTTRYVCSRENYDGVGRWIGYGTMLTLRCSRLDAIQDGVRRRIGRRLRVSELFGERGDRGGRQAARERSSRVAHELRLPPVLEPAGRALPGPRDARFRPATREPIARPRSRSARAVPARFGLLRGALRRDVPPPTNPGR